MPGRRRIWRCVCSGEWPIKFQKEFRVIGFSNDDYIGISFLHKDALVIKLRNCKSQCPTDLRG
jgi:hypothetical protein